MGNTARSLASRYAMAAHQENGTFLETHYVSNNGGRAASGSMYYYLAPGEKSQFHRIDCDEYWCFNAGDPLELWIISRDGQLTRRGFGCAPGCEPTIRLAQGDIFAAKHGEIAEDGTFLTCITVPRFTYDGFELFDREKICRDYPAAAAFFE